MFYITYIIYRQNYKKTNKSEIFYNFFWLGYPDSNRNRYSQSVVCYHYTIPQSIKLIIRCWTLTLKLGLNLTGGFLCSRLGWFLGLGNCDRLSSTGVRFRQLFLEY